MGYSFKVLTALILFFGAPPCQGPEKYAQSSALSIVSSVYAASKPPPPPKPKVKAKQSANKKAPVKKPAFKNKPKKKVSQKNASSQKKSLKPKKDSAVKKTTSSTQKSLKPYKAKQKVSNPQKNTKKQSLKKTDNKAVSSSASKNAKNERLKGLTKKLKGPTLSAKIASTFKNGIYSNRKLKKDETFYKYHGVDNRTGQKTSWLTNKKFTSETRLRSELAIRRDWGVKVTSVSTFKVPKGTWVSEGKAAAQGAKYPGGGYQAVISNLPRSWLIRTDRAF